MFENLLTPMAGIAMATGMIVFSILLLAGLYIYMALAASATAKKLKTKNPWRAWIPIVNFFLMADMAEKNRWPAWMLVGLVILFPFLAIAQSLIFIFPVGIILFGVMSMIWWWKICERRNFPPWTILLTLIPTGGNLWGLILWGILAWKEK